MPDITIRDANHGDVPALLRLLGQLDPPAEAPDEPAARAALDAIARHPGMRLVVAETDGEVVGSVVLAVLPNLTHHAQPWAQLENLIVDEAYRGQGVGRALTQWCEATARAEGCYKLQFQSRNHRKASHRFYRRLGYQALTVGFRRYLTGTLPPPPV
ncbi:MAG: GNAT family N-acetyltransferase [Chloroflexota bacterium]|nr:GNAT family N-acetyltransferase [Chloroflexota bacterium]MDE2970606.1 GNAT family N-acetyltransferase [Chloroflexota bacterium]